MGQSVTGLHTIHSAPMRYGLAVASIALALGVALIFQHYGFLRIESPLFELAVVCVTWFAGPAPAVLAVVLALGCFDYFFVEPLHSFYVSWQLFPYFVLFSMWAMIVAAFVSVRRRIERELLRARDHLEVELEKGLHREKEIGILNKELAKRADELETSNKELESFAYSVSHDLRAPLRHVVGFSELLQRHAAEALDEKSRRYLKTILESATRMGNLIDDLLAFSRIGRAETRKTQFDLDPLVKEVVAEQKQDARGRSIAWKVGDFPACFGDRAMIRMVIVNLVSNAVKFTAVREHAEIEVGCVNLDKDWVQVFVKDNGAGFEMQYVHKLFGVFQRLHLPEQFEGTGIGLAIVQRIVVRHGGKVRAEGVVDGGATFYFSLPKAEFAKAPIASTT
jgi:signal transduction histidine kinase